MKLNYIHFSFVHFEKSSSFKTRYRLAWFGWNLILIIK